MIQKIKKILTVVSSLILGTILFVWLVGEAGLKDVFTTFLTVSLWWLSLFLFLSLLIDLGLALRWKVIIKHHGYFVPFWDCFKYKMIGYAVSYVTPSAFVGGEPVRAMMLKKHGIPVPEAFSTVILDKTIELTSNILFGIIGIFIVLMFLAVPFVTYGILFLIFGIVMLFVFLFFGKLAKDERLLSHMVKKLGLCRFKFFKNLSEKIHDVEVAMSKFMKGDAKGFSTAIVMSIIILLIMFFEYLIGLNIIGVPISIPAVFLVGISVSIAYTIPIPGAIGILEGGQVSAFRMLGQPISLGIVFGLIVRGRDLLKTLTGFWFLSHEGASRLENGEK